MFENKNTNKNQINNDGLPEIAEIAWIKRPLLLGMLGIIFVAILGIYHLNGRKSEQIKQLTEEFYTIKSDVIDNKSDEGKSITAIDKTTPIDPEVMQQQMELLKAKQLELQQRLAAPLMLVNAERTNNNNSAVLSATSTITSGDTNTEFMQQVSEQNNEPVYASTLGSLNTIIAEGNLIHANLETASNSDLPGMLRAIVSVPVYSEDGSQILIPVGARLLGKYKSGLVQGQTFFFTVWTRLLTFDGISIQLDSPGVDSLGVAGMEADEVNRHFWERFGSASLLSLIGAGASNLGVNEQDQHNPASAYREAVANSFAQSASQSLQQDNRIAPTLKKYQGKPIIVFVAKDLHFENALKLVKPKLNIF